MYITEVRKRTRTDLFSLYVLFDQYRSCDDTLEKCFFQISYYSRAYVSIIYEKQKGQIPPGTSIGGNKTYKLKRSIRLRQEEWEQPRPQGAFPSPWRWGGKSALGTRLEWEEPARADLFPVISNRRENFSTLKLYLIDCVCYEFLQFFFLLRHQFRKV